MWRNFLIDPYKFFHNLHRKHLVHEIKFYFFRGCKLKIYDIIKAKLNIVWLMEFLGLCCFNSNTRGKPTNLFIKTMSKQQSNKFQICCSRCEASDFCTENCFSLGENYYFNFIVASEKNRFSLCSLIEILINLSQKRSK